MLDTEYPHTLLKKRKKNLYLIIVEGFLVNLTTVQMCWARNSHTFLTCCQQLRADFALVTLETDAVLSYDSLEQEKFTPELQQISIFFLVK